MTSAWNPENVLDLLGCEVARAILALGSIRPFSAQEFANRCDVSEASIYRRIEVLKDYDLLKEDVAINPRGNNYSRYETNLEGAQIELQDAMFEIQLRQDRDYTDKFVEFWADFEDGAEDFELTIDPLPDSLDSSISPSGTE